MAQTYFNADKLYLKYGTTKAVPTVAGEYHTLSPVRTVEFTQTLSTLTTTETILFDTTFIPKGAWLEAVEIDVQVAAAGGTSVSFGLMKNSDRTTSLGAGGLLNAETTANITLGKVLLYDASTTNHGTLLGTATTDASLITGKVVGTFTAGTIVVRVRYRMP